MTWSDFLSALFPGGLLAERSFVSRRRGAHSSAVPNAPAVSGAQHAGGVSASGHAHGAGVRSAGMKSSSHISWFNASTLLAFLAWFGGVGYILTKHSHLVALAILGFALLAGLLAGLIVFQFMARLVKATSAPMLDWDYRMEGSVGTVSMAIREKGTGEVIFRTRRRAQERWRAQRRRHELAQGGRSGHRALRRWESPM